MTIGAFLYGCTLVGMFYIHEWYFVILGSWAKQGHADRKTGEHIKNIMVPFEIKKL